VLLISPSAKGALFQGFLIIEHTLFYIILILIENIGIYIGLLKNEGTGIRIRLLEWGMGGDGGVPLSTGQGKS